jgi:hypothetical protein
MPRRRRRRNPPLLPLLAVGAVVAYFVLKKPATARKGTVKIQMGDGTTQEVPAWYGPPVTIDGADGTRQVIQSQGPDILYDLNQYGGVFVGPPVSNN